MTNDEHATLANELAAIADEIESGQGLLYMVERGTRSLGIKKTAMVVATLRAPLPGWLDCGAISLIDYIDDLDRHGTIDHGVALELKLRIAKSVPLLPVPPTLNSGAVREALESFVKSWDVNTCGWNNNSLMHARDKARTALSHLNTGDVS